MRLSTGNVSRPPDSGGKNKNRRPGTGDGCEKGYCMKSSTNAAKKQVTNRAIVAEICKIFPKHSTAAHSLALHYDQTGVTFLPEALAIRNAMLAGTPPPRKEERRKNPTRLVVRTTPAVLAKLAAIMERKNIPTFQAALTEALQQYIEKESENVTQ